MFGKCTQCPFLAKVNHQKMLLYRAEIHLAESKFVELLNDYADEHKNCIQNSDPQEALSCCLCDIPSDEGLSSVWCCHNDF